MIKITLGKLLESTQALREISNSQMPLGAALKWNKNVKEIDEVLKMFNDRRTEVAEDYMEEVEDEHGNTNKRVPEDKMEEFAKVMQDILDEELELDVKQVKAENLGDISISPNNLQVLEWIFE